jgi:hypothetical protein
MIIAVVSWFVGRALHCIFLAAGAARPTGQLMTGASKNSEFAQMQGAEKILSRRTWVICKQEIFYAMKQLG